jgi:hypothetical protein
MHGYHLLADRTRQLCAFDLQRPGNLANGRHTRSGFPGLNVRKSVLRNTDFHSEFALREECPLSRLTYPYAYMFHTVSLHAFIVTYK